MDFFVALNQVLILFSIIIIGFIAAKKNILNEASQSSISSILLNIGMPCMSLSSSNIEYSREIIPNIIQIAIITVIFYIAIIAFSMIAGKILGYKNGIYNVFVSLTVFANVGFMGYPVAYAFFKEEGVFYASIVNLIFTSLVWTYGVLLFNSKEKIDFKKLFNIGTISSALAIIFFLIQIKMPYIIQNALDLTGKMTVPMSSILIGAMISQVDFKSLFGDKKVFIVSFLRLLVAPLATAFILKMLNINEMVTAICVLMAAMPSAATNAIFANKYECEPVFASVGVFMTTLLSIASIPFIVFVLTNFIF